MKVDVAIVSGFGRGLWLSAALAKEGLSTCYLDLSEQLGVWAPEDWEGPFGYFLGAGTQEKRPLQIKEMEKEISLNMQIERLHCDESLITNENGFVLWIGGESSVENLYYAPGPIELKGPLSRQRLKQTNFDQDLTSKAGLKKTNRFLANSEIDSLDFLSRIFSNTQLDYEWTQTVKNIYQYETIPLQSEYFIKHTNRKSYFKSLDWAKSKGVIVPEQAQLMDILIENKNQMTGLEVKSNRSFVIQPDEVIWCLSSEETFSVSAKIQKQLFPNGVLEPLWSWIRYRLKIKDCPEQRQFPWHMCMVRDPNLPWTHENFMIIQRTSSVELFDVWIRIPNVQRFNKTYLQEKATACIQEIQTRLPQLEIGLQDEPQEYRYNYKELGGSRFPIYDKKNIAKFKPLKMKNTFFDGPENWSQYTYSSVCIKQESILLEVLKRYFKKQEKLKKQEKNQNKKELDL